MSKPRRSQFGSALDNANAECLAKSWTLEAGVGFLIRLVEQRYNSLYSQFTNDDSITPRQFGVLIALFQKGPMTLTDLASVVQADRSTLGEMIGRMSERRLVLKKDNGADRRSYQVSLAAAGRTELLRRIKGAQELQAEFLSPLSTEDRATFVRCLRIVAYGRQ